MSAASKMVGRAGGGPGLTGARCGDQVLGADVRSSTLSVRFELAEEPSAGRAGWRRLVLRAAGARPGPRAGVRRRRPCSRHSRPCARLHPPKSADMRSPHSTALLTDEERTGADDPGNPADPERCRSVLDVPGRACRRGDRAGQRRWSTDCQWGSASSTPSPASRTNLGTTAAKKFSRLHRGYRRTADVLTVRGPGTREGRRRRDRGDARGPGLVGGTAGDDETAIHRTEVVVAARIRLLGLDERGRPSEPRPGSAYRYRTGTQPGAARNRRTSRLPERGAGRSGNRPNCWLIHAVRDEWRQQDDRITNVIRLLWLREDVSPRSSPCSRQARNSAMAVQIVVVGAATHLTCDRLVRTWIAGWARLRSRVALAKSSAVACRLSRDAEVASVHDPSAGCSGQSRSLGWMERARALPVRGQGFSHLEQ